MRDIDELRHALDAETANLTVHLTADAIRRRARGVQSRRTTGAAAAVLGVAVLAVPAVLSSGGSGAAHDPAGQPPQIPWCSSKSPDVPTLGPLVETGATLAGTGDPARYDVLLGLTGTREYPAFVVAFRDRRTGAVEPWDTTGLGRAPNGDFPGKRPADPTFQFLSSQLTLGPNRVLDVGLYTRAARRIAVASDGHATDARTARNAATGWTFFWVQRTAVPIPPDRKLDYEGPGQLTLTAYTDAGQPLQAVTGGFFVGHNVQNPRDDQPASEGASPKAAATPGEPTPTKTPTC